MREELDKVLQERHGGCGRADPFRRGIVEVLQDDVDTDQGAWPAEAVYEVGRHCCCCL